MLAKQCRLRFVTNCPRKARDSENPRETSPAVRPSEAEGRGVGLATTDAQLGWVLACASVQPAPQALGLGLPFSESTDWLLNT